ncbi:MAG: hypothetical protein UW79_C0036G0010 [Candidatus Yanofskybacteria bacterium GW2011_GWA2_44_9]|uniref:Uncharacterized protein n=1 Tax=Candidatus Yanofskybacteria bacterium GW2011_GWA2_44_9 TaxID=1619025 RepID=A0A0G1MIT4_9BACT|nr:MAG: hypothetical protein UW79_C0036G0010 [Candidatus Yanofskybacteria bacterium GW2011_GWA2_44_9]
MIFVTALTEELFTPLVASRDFLRLGALDAGEPRRTLSPVLAVEEPVLADVLVSESGPYDEEAVSRVSGDVLLALPASHYDGLATVADRSVTFGEERSVLPIDHRRLDEGIGDRLAAVGADDLDAGRNRFIDSEQLVDVRDRQLTVRVSRLRGEVDAPDLEVVRFPVPEERDFASGPEQTGLPNPQLFELKVSSVGFGGEGLHLVLL